MEHKFEKELRVVLYKINAAQVMKGRLSSTEKVHQHITDANSSSKSAYKYKERDLTQNLKTSTATATQAKVAAKPARIRRIEKSKPFNCHIPFCRQKFNHKGHLTQHLRQHILRPFQCNSCRFKFKSEQFLNIHKERKHSGLAKPYKCNLCPKSLTSTTALAYHIKSHTGETSHACSICSKTFKLLTQWKDHVRIVHENQTFQCSSCPLEFKSRAGLYMHNKSKHSEHPPELKRTIKCEFCPKMFRSFSCLTKHIRTHTREKPFSCSFCPFACADEGNLKKHVNAIHKKLKVAKCKYCDKEFASKQQLQSHVPVHTGVKLYGCVTCSKRFATQSDLRSHENVHREENRFKCMMCEKMLASRRGLRNHIIAIHTKENVAKAECEVCHKNFDSTYQLKKHKVIHCEEKPFKCPSCSRRFNFKSNLRDHERRRHSDPIYPCDLCDKVYGLKDALTRHRKSVHERVWRFECSWCDYKTFFKYRLNSHILCHTGEKAYKCEKCGKTFQTRGNLRVHAKRKTPCA